MWLRPAEVAVWKDSNFLDYFARERGSARLLWNAGRPLHNDTLSQTSILTSWKQTVPVTDGSQTPMIRNTDTQPTAISSAYTEDYKWVGQTTNTLQYNRSAVPATHFRDDAHARTQRAVWRHKGLYVQVMSTVSVRTVVRLLDCVR